MAAAYTKEAVSSPYISVQQYEPPLHQPAVPIAVDVSALTPVMEAGYLTTSTQTFGV